jgi:hypothetical protein
LPAIDIGGVTIGLREAVIGLIAGVGLYMAIVVFRMRRLSRKKAEAETRPEAKAPPEIKPGQAVNAYAEVQAEEDDWEAPPPGMADDVLRSGLEQELLQLRDEVDAIRGELAALRNDMRQELASMRATQTVSPLYGDAMQLAAAGYDPAAIAERCGIARAEAELVVALAKSQKPER